MDKNILTDKDLMDLISSNIKDNEKVYICDLCGVWAKDLLLLVHKPDCPDKGIIHGN